jgi:hypothetical protein
MSKKKERLELTVDAENYFDWMYDQRGSVEDLGRDIIARVSKGETITMDLDTMFKGCWYIELGRIIEYDNGDALLDRLLDEVADADGEIHNPSCERELADGRILSIKLVIAEEKEPTGDDRYLECDCCGKKIEMYTTFMADDCFNAYCRDFDCIEGVATSETYLEPCWFGDDY